MDRSYDRDAGGGRPVLSVSPRAESSQKKVRKTTSGRYRDPPKFREKSSREKGSG